MKIPAQKVSAKAPCRVDLAGGTLDIWPLYLFHPGAVTVNFAVNILTRCRITPLPGKRIRLRSLDTKREEDFSSFDELCAARKYRHGWPSTCCVFLLRRAVWNLRPIPNLPQARASPDHRRS